MTENDLDVLGPVDYLVVEFPLDRANFSGEGAEELAKLVEAGTIRVLDLILIRKMEDGTVEAIELDDYEGDVGALRELDNLALQLLAEEDIESLAGAIEAGSLALVLVWENTWAGPFASAMRRAGGQLVANGRIPVQGILAALEAFEAETEGA